MVYVTTGMHGSGSRLIISYADSGSTGSGAR